MWESKELTTSKTGGLLLLFIVIIIGVVLASAMSDTLWESTNRQISTNESIAVGSAREAAIAPDDAAANATTGWNQNLEINFANTATDPIVNYIESVSQVRHVNGTILTLNSDYVVNLTYGRIAMMNSSTNIGFIENTTLVDYTYNPSSFLSSTIGRTLFDNLILIFFIIGLVVWVMGYVYKNYIGDIGF